MPPFAQKQKLPLVGLTSRKVSYEFFVSWFVSKLNTEILESAVSALELIFIREDYLSLPGHFLNKENINQLITSTVT